ncbi:MAG: hypothetical protein FJZ43_01945 [Candidatus Staskawiczbacteria bacterium]|nr:hypothetical protein [Candidatus Staskawiczbacteria bacterium]
MSQNVLANGLTFEEENNLINLLLKVDPTMMGTRLFDAIASKTVSLAIEAVCIRYKPFSKTLGIPEDELELKNLQVYMTQRLPDDTAYPKEWHCPGSVVRPGDNFYNALNRLNQAEFGGMMFPRQFVADVNNRNEKRGHFLSKVYLCQFKGEENDRGKWFDINNLPKETVHFHRTKIIPVGLGAFVCQG